MRVDIRLRPRSERNLQPAGGYPFDPTLRYAIERAHKELEKKARFEGLLPVGQYSLAGRDMVLGVTQAISRKSLVLIRQEKDGSLKQQAVEGPWDTFARKSGVLGCIASDFGGAFLGDVDCSGTIYPAPDFLGEDSKKTVCMIETKLELGGILKSTLFFGSIFAWVTSPLSVPPLEETARALQAVPLITREAIKKDIQLLMVTKRLNSEEKAFWNAKLRDLEASK